MSAKTKARPRPAAKPAAFDPHAEVAWREDGLRRAELGEFRAAAYPVAGGRWAWCVRRGTEGETAAYGDARDREWAERDATAALRRAAGAGAEGRAVA